MKLNYHYTHTTIVYATLQTWSDTTTTTCGLRPLAVWWLERLGGWVVPFSALLAGQMAGEELKCPEKGKAS